MAPRDPGLLPVPTCWGCRPRPRADPPRPWCHRRCVVSKALSVQPFLQACPASAAPPSAPCSPSRASRGLPSSSPKGAHNNHARPGPIHVVSQPSRPHFTTLSSWRQYVSGYLASAASGPSEPVTLASADVSPQGAGLVLQEEPPALWPTTLNGTRCSEGGSCPKRRPVGRPQDSRWQWLTWKHGPLVGWRPVMFHAPTPTDSSPACWRAAPKLYQLTPKPFAPAVTPRLPSRARLGPSC